MGPTVNPAPGQRWTFAEYAVLAVLVAAAGVLFFSGLSWRSLWGSEGRWAVIAREMMLSGDYFLPTINGVVYFDKPLLSYWAIIPFSLFSGVTEMSARLPGALAGVGTVALIFAIGRGLFGLTPGLYAGLVLLTTVMFGFWSRTASAEVLNVLAIWSMLWVLQGRGAGRPFHRYLSFYLIAAVSSFCKGPLAPAVAVTAVIAVSCVETIWDIRQDGFGRTRMKAAEQFDWYLGKDLGAVWALLFVCFSCGDMTGMGSVEFVGGERGAVLNLRSVEHSKYSNISCSDQLELIASDLNNERWGGGWRRWLHRDGAILFYLSVQGGVLTYCLVRLRVI